MRKENVKFFGLVSLEIVMFFQGSQLVSCSGFKFLNCSPLTVGTRGVELVRNPYS